MKTIHLPFLLLIASLTLSTLSLTQGSVQAQQRTSGRPNFILFITDDIGWNDLGCYGNDAVQTPHIDQLAARGLKFQNAYVTASSCSPSRCSVISGRYPHNTGAPELHDPLPEGQLMFPQLLKEAGYYTALSGKNHMGPQTAHAFDTISKGQGPGGEEDWTTLIRERPEDQPFFFWFASKDAHRDWQFDDRGRNYQPKDVIVPPMLYDGPITRKDLAGYYHEISRADYYLGQLLQELEREGELENTFIIFMSDNGRPFPRAKTRLYDSGLKVPFIVYGPEVKKGISESLISTVDIAPTILELAGVTIDERIQGRSFRPIIQDNIKATTRDFVFGEHNWHVFQAHERLVRYGDWVYIRNAYPEKRALAGESTRVFPAGEELWDAHDKGLTRPEQEDVFLKPRPAEELYNVASDPYQFKNLAQEQEQAEMLEFLSGILDVWIRETGDSKPLNPTPDREDVYGKKLPGKFEKGDKPGEARNATRINHPGPIRNPNL